MSEDAKVALVTGGARRVGKQICLSLHEKGYKLVVHCNSSAEDASNLVQQLNGERSSSAIYIVKDLSTKADISAKEIVEQAASEWGRLDLVVNNASNFFGNTLDDVTADVFDLACNVNLKAPVFIMQAASPYLRKTRGNIVNLLDLIGVKPKASHFSHSVSKAGLLMATQNAALTLAPHVRVNAIAPGCVQWPEVDPQLFNEEEKQNWLQKTPMKKFGSPKDVADAVLFLSSPEAGFITGQVLHLDGGRGLYF